MRKIDLEFCLSDDTVNVYGYRLLTRGVKLDRFLPPIGYIMHKREEGVALRWEDLEVRQGALYGKPVVNDILFPNLAQQIEEGFYNAASVGHIVALKMSDDPKDKLEGQSGVTVTEWFPREISIVDIPGNYDAIARLYAEDDKLLMDLSDKCDFYYPEKKESMSYLTLTAEDYAVLNLSAGTSSDNLSDTLRDLVAKANRAENLERELNDLKASAAKERVDAILSQAIAERKMFPAVAAKLRDAYSDNPDGLKDLVDTLPKQVDVKTIVTDEKVPADLADKSWKELWSEGRLEEVRKKYPDFYNQLKEERDGTN